MLIAISQDNIDLGVKGYADTLENNYSKYFNSFGITLIPISNSITVINSFEEIPIKAIILTGGTDIGKRLIRDNTEKMLLDIAVKKRIPVLGICRGMQFINYYFKGTLIEDINKNVIDNIGHVHVDHEIQLLEEAQKFFNKDTVLTNSYHNQGVNQKTLSPELKVFAKTKDGIIEGLFHPNYPIAGIQWHPERKSPDEEFNEKMMNAFLNEEFYWRIR